MIRKSFHKIDSYLISSHPRRVILSDIFSGSLFDIYSGILFEIYSGNFLGFYLTSILTFFVAFWCLVRFVSGIISGIGFGVLFGIYSLILFGILSGTWAHAPPQRPELAIWCWGPGVPHSIWS